MAPAAPLPVAALLWWGQWLALAGYIAAQLLLVLYASHRYLLLWRLGRRARRRESGGRPGPPARAGRDPTAWPRVTVQLPVFNESRVVTRLIAAVAGLRYPAGRLEIQVLDDSTDETRMWAAAAVARGRAAGVDIHHLHRPARTGFKAGALAAGLVQARGDLVAVFDADFVPPADFLLRLVPHFDDSRVGMVQARWGHLNRTRSWLTAAQATLLDAHFLIEHAARMRAGLFFNFNGSAGIWRRTCIADAGGWSSDTVTEDLDLSYRAQLKGWRFVFDPRTEAPGELPTDMEALKSQQRRWTRGAIQTARKLLPAIWRAPLPLGVRLEAVLHLTCNAAYPLSLLLGLLMLPVMLVPLALPPALLGGVQAGLLALGIVPACLFLAVGRRLAGGTWLQVVRDVPVALLLGIGLSVNNAGAVLAGFDRRAGAWERTPKTGDTEHAPARGRRYPSAARPAGRAELSLGAWFVAVGAIAWSAGNPGALPFAALLAAGFGAVGLGSVRARLASRRAADEA